MRVEFVNEQGFSLGVCETPAIIERYRNTQGMFEVPLCEAFFYKRRWCFDNLAWIEGATPEEIAEANKPIVPSQALLSFLNIPKDSVVNPLSVISGNLLTVQLVAVCSNNSKVSFCKFIL
jgi:hypothetical protein